MNSKMARVFIRQVRKDSNSERRNLFTVYLRNRRLLSVFFPWLETTKGSGSSFAINVFVALILASKKIPTPLGHYIAPYQLRGQRAGINKFIDLVQFSKIQVFELNQFSIVSFLRLSSILLMKSLVSFYRENDVTPFLRYSRRVPPYVLIRGLQSVFLYLLFKESWKRLQDRVLFISSTGNPYAVAALVVAEEQDWKIVFLSHAPIDLFVKPFKADLAVVHGEYAERAYRESGARIKNYNYWPNTIRPMNFSVNQKALLALSKDTESHAIEQLMHQLPITMPVSLRLHPHSLASINLRRLKERFSNLEIKSIDLIEDELNDVSLVFVGNSGAALDSLAYGKPTFFVPAFDAPSTPKHAFLDKKRIVITYDFNITFSENFNAAKAWYSDSNWKSQLLHYMNTDTEKFKRKTIMSLLDLADPSY